MEDQEKNITLDKPESWGAKSKTNVTTSIPLNVWRMAKENNIAWNDALEFGILFKIADQDGFDYPDSKQNDKVQRLARTLQAKIDECEALRNQLAGVKNPDLEEEIKSDIDKVFVEVKKDGGK